MGKKAKLGLLLAAAIIFAIAAPVFAAGSPEAAAVTAVDATGKVVEVTFSSNVPEAVAVSAQAEIPRTANQTLSVFDYTISGGTPPYTIEIPAGDVKTATVYHYEGGAWVPLKTWIKDGKIYAETMSASPFALVSSKVAPQSSVDVTNTPTGSWITLPAGTVYYDMVEGRPGASHKLTKATQAEVVEKLNNGYTKILIGTTTYLIKTSGATVAGTTTTTGKSPKTGAESDMDMMLIIVGAALASVAIFAGKKALKVQD